MGFNIPDLTTEQTKSDAKLIFTTFIQSLFSLAPEQLTTPDCLL